jgi:hypothetical protein
MAKPIFLIGFPIEAELSSISGIQSQIHSLLGEEYHILAYKTSRIRDISFEVLNAINATDIEISDLISKVKEEIQSLLQNNTQDANA